MVTSRRPTLVLRIGVAFAGVEFYALHGPSPQEDHKNLPRGERTPDYSLHVRLNLKNTVLSSLSITCILPASIAFAFTSTEELHAFNRGLMQLQLACLAYECAFIRLRARAQEITLVTALYSLGSACAVIFCPAPSPSRVGSLLASIGLKHYALGGLCLERSKQNLV